MTLDTKQDRERLRELLAEANAALAIFEETGATQVTEPGRTYIAALLEAAPTLLDAADERDALKAEVARLKNEIQCVNRAVQARAVLADGQEEG